MAAGVRRARSRPVRAGLLLRILLILLGAFAVGWVVAAAGMAALSRNARPDLALRFMPSDARAQAKAAEQVLSRRGGRRGNVDEAERLARRALQRDPTIVVAWRTLGLVATMRRQDQRAAQLFHISERMSRRDLPTQLWLIEEKVQQNDIVGALRHYDAALRTSPSSAELLMPILVSASEGSAVAASLVQLLASGPPWLRAFLVALSEHVPPGEKVAALLEAMHRARPITDRDIVGSIVFQLVDRREFGPAWRVYRLLGNRAGLLRNGEFDGTAPLAPFDWQMEARSELEAQQRPLDDSGADWALLIHADGGNSGPVARQLLLLPAGAYALEAVAGAIEGTAPAALRWEIACANPEATSLAGFEIPPLNAGGRPHRVDFRVPSGCPAQWLRLGARAEDGSGGADAWVDSATIRAASGSSR